MLWINTNATVGGQLHRYDDAAQLFDGCLRDLIAEKFHGKSEQFRLREQTESGSDQAGRHCLSLQMWQPCDN